jgi:hypothetical protein
MSLLRKIVFVVLVKPENKLVFLIHQRALSPPSSHWSYYTWTYFGPEAYMSIGGHKYGLVIVDDYSRFTWVFFLHDKSVVQDTLKKFAKRAQN